MVTPIINGVSDHDAELLIISTDDSSVPIHKFKTIKKINKYTISDFDKLGCESWDTIFNSEDVNAMFNSFLNIALDHVITVPFILFVFVLLLDF
jgi:hypothetical protein